MRLDLTLVRQWIAPESRVIDLGCGDGELLAHLRDTLNVRGYGLEIDADKITAAIGRGVNVIEQDLNHGLANIENDSFDTLLMAQALRFLMRSDVTRPLVPMLTRLAYEDFMQWAQRSANPAIPCSRARSRSPKDSNTKPMAYSGWRRS